MANQSMHAPIEETSHKFQFKIIFYHYSIMYIMCTSFLLYTALKMRYMCLHSLALLPCQYPAAAADNVRLCYSRCKALVKCKLYQQNDAGNWEFQTGSKNKNHSGYAVLSDRSGRDICIKLLFSISNMTKLGDMLCGVWLGEAGETASARNDLQ